MYENIIILLYLKKFEMEKLINNNKKREDMVYGKIK